FALREGVVDSVAFRSDFFIRGFDDRGFPSLHRQYLYLAFEPIGGIQHVPESLERFSEGFNAFITTVRNRKNQEPFLVCGPVAESGVMGVTPRADHVGKKPV